MALPVLTAAARALLATPAGKKAIYKGSKAVARFLKGADPAAFVSSAAQKAAGQRLQSTMKRRARNAKIRVAGAAGAAGYGAAELSNEEGPIDMKAKGGLIKSRIDGIAAKGKTRAKHR